MQDELNLLFSKIQQLIDVVEHLRVENAGLRKTLDSLEHERLQLQQKIQSASERLDNLLAQLPTNHVAG